MASDLTLPQTQLQLSIISALAPPLHFSEAIYLLSSSILDTYGPGGLSFWYHIFLLFHPVQGFPEARMKWFAIPFSSGHVLSKLSTMTRPSWVALHGMAHSFTELHRL